MSEALKFAAVPSAIFEFLPDEKRQRIEEWLLRNLAKIVKNLLITLVFLCIAILMMVKLGPLLVGIWLVLGRRITNLALTIFSDMVTAYVAYVCEAVVVFIAAVIVAVASHKAILLVGLPFETFSTWVSGFPVLHIFVPHFSGEAFLADFSSVFENTRAWLRRWFGLPNWFITYYFFLAKGFVLVVLVMIQCAFFAALVLFTLLVPASVATLFVKGSDFIKRKFGIVTERIPLGAGLLLALGETVEFAQKTVDFFGGGK